MRAFAFALLLAGCSPGLGERCNPLQFHDECGDGLQCVVPTGCAVAYCCPPPDQVDSTTNPRCLVCMDGGAEPLVSADL